MPITTLIYGKINIEGCIISKKIKKVENYFDKFAESIKDDIYRDTIIEERTLADLELTISVALA